MTIKNRFKFSIRSVALLNIFVLLTVFTFQTLILPQQVKAAALTNAYVRYDRMATATATNVLVVFKPSTITAVDRIKVTFGSATVGGVCTVGVSNLPTGVTALPTGSSLTCTTSGQTVTIGAVSTLTTNTYYGFNIATGITTGSAGSTTDTVFTHNGTSTVETTDVGVQYVASGADQIVVSATVAPTFSFTLGANVDSFTSNLSASAVRVSSGVAVTVATNALSGWTGWVKDSNQGLTSSLASTTIATTGTVNGATSTLSAGTEGYVLSAAATSGSPSIDAEYAGNGTTTGGTLSSTFQPFATGSGPTASQVVTLKELAAISSTTKAASDYTDTLTVVGAANF